jgi:hypothetical protein
MAFALRNVSVVYWKKKPEEDRDESMGVVEVLEL